ncbi:hypothetical protein VVAX_02439 [Variovorax paradoxus]|uniref:Heme-binding protein n=2 Tax=Variovorax paradoxus TaxID=34073 RepID=A0A679J725_VARPD|nr:hypothetical protein VVAX_02439 [Variovorax paradoxus]
MILSLPRHLAGSLGAKDTLFGMAVMLSGFTQPEHIMKTKSFLELADVKAVAAAAEAEAIKNNWAVTIAISDDAGNLLWLQRLDGAVALSSHIAPAKAHTAAMGRRESKVYEDIINGGRTAFLTAPEVQGLLEGGVPIVKDGHVIGAVGVSGVKSNEDAQIAKAGIAALGL